METKQAGYFKSWQTTTRSIVRSNGFDDAARVGPRFGIIALAIAVRLAPLHSTNSINLLVDDIDSRAGTMSGYWQACPFKKSQSILTCFIPVDIDSKVKF